MITALLRNHQRRKNGGLVFWGGRTTQWVVVASEKDEMRQRILDEMELFERFLGCTLWKGNWLHPITLVIHLIVVGELVRLCSHGNPL